MGIIEEKTSLGGSKKSVRELFLQSRKMREMLFSTSTVRRIKNLKFKVVCVEETMGNERLRRPDNCTNE